MKVPALPVMPILLAGMLSWLAVRLSLVWARRQGMLDLPGRRRSHRRPTPRGGGIGMMLVLLLLLPWAGLGGAVTLAVGAALAGVAVIGAWDDVAPRGIGVRLLVQGLAVSLAAAVLLSQAQRSPGWLLLVIPLGMWSINLHNFMDGIDGLLAGHCLVVAWVLAALAEHQGLSGIAVSAAMLAAASAGFLYFNWAPARIFMGDAGSGGCGLLIFVLSLGLTIQRPGLLWAVLALSSSFTVDAGLTLLHRIRHGRRWTQPHREHLYQWQVRLGRGHARVSLAYLGWDAGVGLWVWLRAQQPAGMLVDCLLIHALASLIWLGYKSYCLRLRREQEVS